VARPTFSKKVTLEVVTIDGDHRYQQNSLGLYSDSFIESHKKLVDAIHANGAKVVPQISHTGPESLGGFFKNIQPVGPSVVRTATTLQVCRELAIAEIPRLVSMYGDAAVRARAAGYDGIELHAAHSYMLLGSFLSPLRNHRTDAYKGSKPEGRMKLLLEVLAEAAPRFEPAILSGPSFAKDAARGLPTAVTIAARDMLLVFSVGGGDMEKQVSANLVAAIQYARTVGAKVTGIVGRDGGYTARNADACVVVPTVNATHVTPHTEAFQAVIWH